jgi:phasin family protein
MFNTAPLVAAQRPHANSPFSLIDAALEGAQRLVKLNLEVASASSEDAARCAAATMRVKDPRELLALQVSLLPQAFDKVAAYWRQLGEIGDAVSAEVDQVVEAQWASVRNSWTSVAGNAARNAPVDAESAVNGLGDRQHRS